MRIFIGYDPRETVAYHVLAHSILQRASRPVQITPLCRWHLGKIHTRPRGPNESTDFSITRFLVPYLSGYQGTSIFMDCDMLCLDDIWKVFDEVPTYAYESVAPPPYPQFAVRVCKHDYTPKTTTKFLGQSQAKYPKKNWSSFMVFDNARCKALTPEVVNMADGLWLHRFQWLQEKEVGSLGLEWNWLVGEYEPLLKEGKILHHTLGGPRILHYTLGGPWFPEYKDCDHAGLWFQELESLRSAG